MIRTGYRSLAAVVALVAALLAPSVATTVSHRPVSVAPLVCAASAERSNAELAARLNLRLDVVTRVVEASDCPRSYR